MKVLITGADGFIGKNLRATLAQQARHEVLTVTRATTDAQRAELVANADVVVHLAGVNRPKDPSEFAIGNTEATAALCKLLRQQGRPIAVLYASSTQAELDNPYGLSKRHAEELLRAYGSEAKAKVAVYRLPNVFGKWCRPNYNSAVGTFCHNVARGLPITVNDPAAPLRLVYVDDVVSELIEAIEGRGRGEVQPVYATTVGEVASAISSFEDVRKSLVIGPVGTGLWRALYATYVSYLEPSRFSYGLSKHEDPRGMFVEMLKTKDSGQFSFFTAHPGVTRGGHYHHTKTEKFLVLKGKARFRFRHILSDETFEQHTDGREPVVVETIPGWAHDITNVGEDEMIVMLWANEIFDRGRPDTYSHRV